MAVTTPFQTLFAVPMTCDGCVKAVSDSLYKLNGITKVEASLADQLVSVEGTAPPSAIVDVIQATGKDAILRGSGASNNAAVCILETYSRPEGEAPVKKPGDSDREVRGLARMVQVAANATLIDLTLRGVSPGTYRATIREFGDLKDGASSTGPVWSGSATAAAAGVNVGQKEGSSGGGGGGSSPRGLLGTLEVDSQGRGSVFLNHPLQIWEIIGHALVVTPHEEADGKPLPNDDDTVVGVVARSAGMWDNDKTVCSCTGKTLWEERNDEVKKGML